MEFCDIITLAEKAKEDDAKAIWYRFNCRGRVPSARVGHSCIWLSNVHRHKLSFPDKKSYGSIFCVGGANPDGTFREVHNLDLNLSAWTAGNSGDFTARYEHSMFDYIDSTDKLKVAVFGGANEKGNLCDVQEYDVTTETWVSILQKDDFEKIPEPRTHHTTAILSSKKLVVFGGGSCSSSPVEDVKVHVYDPVTQIWMQPEVEGEPPKPRQGHVMTVIKDKVYVHGGMCGTEFFDDLHLLDLDNKQWSQVLPDSLSPSARAGHGSVNLDKSFLIFGGLTMQGPNNDLYSFHTDSLKWTKYSVTGDIPSSRLDFAIAKIEIDSKKLNPDKEEICLMFLHGGMNVDGDVFDDAYICYLTST